MIEFAWENQGNWSARCLAGQADSPVYTNAGDGGGSSAFEVVRDSLNAFLITLCLQEAVMSAPVLYAIDGPPLVQIPSGPPFNLSGCKGRAQFETVESTSSTFQKGTSLSWAMGPHGWDRIRPRRFG